MESIGLKAILEDSNFQAGLKRYQNGVGQMEKSTERAASVLSRAGAVMQGAFVAGIGAATLSIGAFVAASKIGLDATLQWSEGLDKLGDQFGMTGEQGSAFQFLANKVGVSVDEMGFGLNSITNGLSGIEDRLKSGSKTLSPFEQGLSKIGVSAFNSKGKLKTFDELLPDLMDAFNKLPPGIKASSVAMDLFGTRGGGKFLDFLRQGSKGLDEARKKAKALGLELSTDEVNAAEEFGFAMNELNLGIKGFWNQIGRQVLPILRRFVDFVNSRVLPVFVDLAKRYAPLIGAALDKISNVLDKIIRGFQGDWNPFIEFIDRAFGRSAANNIAQFIQALGGIADGIGKIVASFKTGGLAGGLQEIGNQLGNAFKNIDWTAVSKNLDGMKTKFWTWLTGEGGVLSQVGAQLGKVITAIGGWLSESKNTQPIVDAVIGKNGLVARFWEWLTNPTSGAIILVAEKMGELIDQIRQWSEDAKTKRQFEKIGETVERTIIDGIHSFFSDSGNLVPSGDALGRSLGTIPGNIRSTLSSIGGSIASGLIQGIISYVIPQDMIDRIRGSINSWMTAAVRAFVLGDSSRLVQMIIDAILGKAPAPTPPGGGGSSGFPTTPPPPNNWNTKPKPIGWFAEGGPIRRTGMAMVHAGEYVLNRQQAMAWAPALASTSNVYNFNHTWPAAVPPSQREWTESMVRSVTQQEVRGILGKG